MAATFCRVPPLDRSIARFVVIGAGAIGGVVGGRLQQHGHDVVFVARGAHGEAMASRGLRVVSPEGATTLDVAVVPSPDVLEIGDDDVVLLAVKSQDTVPALDRLRDAAGDAEPPVVCLQNGVNNEREALRRFRHVQGAVVMCPAAHLAAGEVRAYSAPTTGLIDVGRFPDGIDEVTTAVAGALQRSSFSSEAIPAILRWKWSKLLTNLGNAIEAVCGPPARRSPLGKLVREEAEGVLRAAGIDFASSAEDAERRGDLLTLLPVDGEVRPGGSSWQSLARGAGTIETDYLNGEIVLLGRLHGVPTPMNEALMDHARRMARTGSPPGTVDPEQLIGTDRG